jgi:hypothetical protein
MIEWEQAHQIASAHAAAIPLAVEGDRAVVDDRHTSAYEFGWLFVYQSSWFLQTGDRRWMVYDNHPFLVDRRDGRILVVPLPDRDALMSRFRQEWDQGQPLA